MLGADGRVDAPGLDAWRLGVAAGYTDDTLALNLRSSRGEVKTVFGGLYAGALYGALDIKLGLSGISCGSGMIGNGGDSPCLHARRRGYRRSCSTSSWTAPRRRRLSTRMAFSTS
ncbi:autotransporter domain-containing protein [Methylobacterium persicinum]|uniref:autotransporter domain-containing protein n=1 Tax=Methylobacterium persicinum TaxID=374426 RepID=UPI00351FBAEB